MLRAMIEAAPDAGINCIVTEQYQGNSRLLMSYGLGHLGRRVHTDAHVKCGGRLIGWDLGYWDRDQSMRCTIDRDHVHSIPEMPGERWASAGIELRDDGNKNGPIVLVGIGKKSRDQFGLAGQEWELRALKAVRKTHPKRKIVYRPKKGEETLAGCVSVYGPIEEVLCGASLVVCRHSNVAVDACIAGVPVVCEDGAAASLYSQDIANPDVPSREQRLCFLQNLAWWQYRPDEAFVAWQFLLKVIRDRDS